MEFNHKPAKFYCPKKEKSEGPINLTNHWRKSRYNTLYTHTPFVPCWSALIGPPISEIQLFQNLMLKIQGQAHGWGQSSKWQNGSNIQSSHIPFIPCHSGIPFLSYDFFKILPWKIKGQGHGWGHISKSQCESNILRLTTLSFHVNRPSHSWDTAFS